MSKIDIRAKLHNVLGHIRRNEIIDAYELVLKMSAQMDEEFYKDKGECPTGIDGEKIHIVTIGKSTCNCGKMKCTYEEREY